MTNAHHDSHRRRLIAQTMQWTGVATLVSIFSVTRARANPQPTAT